MIQSADGITISLDAPLLEALGKLEKSAIKILFVVDEDGRLVGACTDGDVRRGILKAGDLSAKAREIMNRSPIAIDEGMNPGDVRDLLRRHEIGVVPVVDAARRIKGVITHDTAARGVALETPVVLMAGGLGERLRPLTEDCPKPLLALGKKPILSHIIDQFVDQGFRRFFISVNYLGHMIEEYFGSGHDRGIEISYLREDKRLGTGGALQLLPQNMNYPFLVMNGDLVTETDFRALVNSHRESGAVATMCVREHRTSIPFGVVRFDGAAYQLTEEKPTIRNHINAGIYCLSKEARDAVPQDSYYDMPSLFDDLARESQPCSVHVIHDAWLDIGSIDEYERAQQRFEE
ncbi:MAG: alcohol dehydrogenase [Hyphobacterium sp.]|nr:MAG: alcohol dehydrogenase [Marinicaulis sp.]GJL98142.1 MAG: alcohol dehydrogenase [Hyphobacterium sp.]